jgi:hypothetical protein
MNSGYTKDVYYAHSAGARKQAAQVVAEKFHEPVTDLTQPSTDFDLYEA